MPNWNSYITSINATNKLSELKLDDIIDYAAWFVPEYLLGKKTYQKQVKTHQIRRFYDAIKNIEFSVKATDYDNKQKAKLLMLRPQLANASGKQKDLKKLSEVCTAMIKKVKDQEDFFCFFNFFQSIVAFHKAEARDK